MAILAPKSLRHKVTLMLMSTAGLAMLLAAMCFLAFEVHALRAQAAGDLRSLGNIIAYNVNSAVAFNDPEASAEILGVLKERQHLTAARVYRADGSLLASFPAGDTGPESAAPLTQAAETFAQPWTGRASLSRFIRSEDGRPIGMLHLEADQGDVVDHVAWTGLVLAVITLLLGLVTYLFASWFQGLLTRPILGLVEVVTGVAVSQDYGLRATQASEDELGLLAGSINTMLARIQDQEARLAHHREHLEKEVAQRTAELVQANTDLQMAKDRAEASSRAKSSFLANMSHELRTPLNAILLYSEVIRNEAEDSGTRDVLADITQVETAGRHLLSLINDILDLAKIESGKMTLVSEPFAVREVLEGVLGTVANLAAQRGNTLTMACAPELTEMVGDATKVRQVLLNLLSNACKFTKDGKIHVEAGLAEALSPGSPWVSISVTDTGIGISQEQVERIFNEFIQGDDSTTRRFGGTGLGLTLSRKFCQVMGGEVRVKSAPGLGSTFTMFLPLEPSVEPPRDVPAATAQPAPRGRLVLLVDEDPFLLASLTRLLAKDGYQVQSARDGVQGLALARELRPAIIVLDVILPRLDGWEVLHALKADPALADIPVVLLTILEEAEKGLSLGAVDYLHKPLDREKLSRVLARHLAPQPASPVLVVEDDGPTREAMVRILQSSNLEALTAGDGLEALACLGMCRPGVILLDLMMPTMDGFQFLLEKQKNPDWADIPLVVVTARELSAEDRRRLKEAGVAKTLQKGVYRRKDLLEEVRRLVNLNLGAGTGGA